MKYIYIGKIVNTHGIKGEIRLLSHFPYKDKVFKPNTTIYIGETKTQETINTYRPHKQFDMITLKNYNNINDVLKYKGQKAYTTKEELHLQETEYLDEDLIGLNVIIKDQIIGTIKKIELYPHQNLLVVKTAKKDCLIPYVNDIIEEINLEKKYIKIKNIKGLI